MSVYEGQGLVMRQMLTEAEVAAIKKLAAICNDYEGLHMRVGNIQPGLPVISWLYYVEGELTGYLGIETDDIETAELTGMVHPDYRRMGIMRMLLSTAYAECADRGLKQLILICERSSGSGKAFIEASGAPFVQAEHEMELAQFLDRSTFDDRLVIRVADASDLDALILIRMKGMGYTEEYARLRDEHLLKEPDSQIYLATFGVEGVSCGEPVGMMRVYDWAECFGLYGFVIIPDYRGRGYGRQMLEEIIRSLRSRSQKTIMLDVNVDNTNALGLYRSCGFVIKTTYDYHVISI